MDKSDLSENDLIEELSSLRHDYEILKNNYETEIRNHETLKESLRLSELLNKSTIENAPMGMHFYQLTQDNQLIFLKANKAADKLLGIDNSVFVGRTIEEAFPPLQFTEVPDRYRRAAAFGEIWSTEQIDYEEGKIKGAFEVTAFQTQPNHMVAMFAEITARKQAQEELQIFMEAIEASSAAIGMSTPEGKHYYQNQAFDKLFGKIGDFPPDTIYVDKKIGEEVFSTIMAGGNWTGEVKMYSANKQILDILLRAYSAKDSNGNIKALVGVHYDITESKKVEQELVKAKEKAEESDRLKSSFLANMSHEIRTPMNGILGFAELLNSPGLSLEDQKTYIQIIEKSGRRMLNIINDIIDISKIEAGLVELRISQTVVNNQMDFMFNFFKPEVEAKGLKFSYSCPLPTDDSVINTDRDKLYAILTNLIKNAIKFTAEGSIEFGYSVKDHNLLFFVKDTGIGIPKNRQMAVFERFIQADIEDTAAIQGAGLGLAIAKAYVEMMGGKIWVESLTDSGNHQSGTTFCFTLPIKKLKIVNKKEEREPTIDLEIKHFKKLKILIAEDDSVSELLLEIAVKDIARHVLKVSNGKDAIEQCRKNPDIDIVLLDLKMPETNGYDAVAQIRSFNKKLIIIAQSAYGMFGDREKAIAAGCNDYISKPIDKKKLLQLIAKYM